MSSNLYFAYGSNLNIDDFRAWCGKRGFPTDLLKFKAVVSAPDYRLGFTHYSQSRNGGVLDLVACRGQIVRGVLFEVTGQGWEALNKKEGAPTSYKKETITVIDELGNLHDAETYIVNAEMKSDKANRYIKPSVEYLRIVREGLDHWDLDHELLDAASNNEDADFPNGFFFYGTLLRGEKRFPVIEKYGIECVLLASAFGRLVDLGDYPGLVGDGRETSIVHGEFVRLSDPRKALKELDAIEGFMGYGKPHSLFHRTRMSVDVGDGRIREAWTYRLASEPKRAQVIASGDWREHLNRRREFLMRLAAIHVNGQESQVARRVACGYPFLTDEDRKAMTKSLQPLHESLANGMLSERKLAQASGLWNAIP